MERHCLPPATRESLCFHCSSGYRGGGGASPEPTVIVTVASTSPPPLTYLCAKNKNKQVRNQWLCTSGRRA